MFVRWKRKQLKDDRLKYAQLVKTVQVTGKPRQKVIKYLGSIRESHLECKDYCKQFWDKVNDNLEKLDLEERTVEQVKFKLQQTVPIF